MATSALDRITDLMEAFPDHVAIDYDVENSEFMVKISAIIFVANGETNVVGYGTATTLLSALGRAMSDADKAIKPLLG